MSPTSPFRDAAELDVPPEAQAYSAAVEATTPAVMSPFRDIAAPLPEHADGEREWQPQLLDASFEEVRPEDAGAGPSERAAVRGEIRAGRKDPTELANKVFLLRHPERTGTRIAAHEPALKAEWLRIRAELVVPLLLSGPEIGPIHDRATPVSPDLRKGVPAGAVLSPL
ncbi:MAG: hypothetical protein QOJ85_371, partial [Solirubrobacteraceae bacterium]|nr:hypothetical protein [Solirubrobacteraceae bacterium]